MKSYQILCGITGCILLLSGMQAISASASHPEIRNIALPLAEENETTDGLIYDENGNAHFMIQNQMQTGRFSITPEYHKGDIDGSNMTDSLDAAYILYAAAAAGTENQSPEEILLSQHETLTSTYQTLQITDINGDQMIDAADAAGILIYASEQGAGKLSEPLGFACYQADENGNLQKGWLDDRHYADEDYKLHTGWAEIENQKYYFSEYGEMQTGFTEIYDRNYYFDSDSGIMLTGWQTLENQIYYFNPDGVQQTGFQNIDDNIYYFNPDGILQKGFQNIGDKNYYFDNNSGIMLTGWQTLDNQIYYFNTDGVQQTGWQDIDEHTYYFDTNGIMQTGLVTIEDKTYRFQTDGIYHPRKICLDAGHYGSRYNHSPVVNSYYESNFTWDMHLHLIPALESYGFEVITTREKKEEDLGLRERGHMSEGCDLFLSVHSNYDNNYSLDFPLACCQVSGVTDELGLQLANKIHEVMGTNQSGRIWKRESTNEPGNDWYSVLYGAAEVGTPGILLEHSFHSNYRATKWLMVDENLERMAQAEAKVISDYFGF
ncbi:MAG: N-acetylmuramoyl-L-alanine amidase [Oscillospiraceae bacterium]|nr:N-acetylmuramoyl-L-alanine amidase [Oscillospiraceae bacterium]